MSDVEAEAPVISKSRPVTLFAEGEANRARFLAELRRQEGMVTRAREAAGISKHTYKAWRERWPDFRAKVDMVRSEFAGGAQKDGEYNPAKAKPRDFAGFRKRYFGFDSPGFHLRVIDALESAPEGSVTMVLLPPEHGKTTLIEDWCCKKLDDDPNFRITIGSEKQNHGKKIIARVKSRMDPRTGPVDFIAECGPFAPEEGVRRTQVWAEDRFNVYKRSGEERDYSMIAQGVTSAVAGTRADLMIIDDIQSLKSLNQTAEIFAQLRQDWLSRTGAFGRVVIIGTRVGPGDVYEKLEESTLVNRVIKIPAYDFVDETWPEPEGHNPKEDPAQIPFHITTFLWPERYSPLNYLVMRVNAGEEGWNRNYLQRGEAAGAQPFTKDMLRAVQMPEWSTTYLERHRNLTAELVVTLDPGFGVNCTMASLMTEKFVMPILWRSDEGLTNNQQIWQIVEETIYTVQQGDQLVTEMVIEDKAFQKGLMDDEGLIALRDRFNFRVHGHQTGENKYDPDLGIPQMARAFERREILLPGGADVSTRNALLLLEEQMLKWRPYKRGNRLTQDLVITLWFAWMTWRSVRHLIGRNLLVGQSWKGQALPSPTTTASGLLLPTGAYGRG